MHPPSRELSLALVDVAEALYRAGFTARAVDAPTRARVEVLVVESRAVLELLDHDAHGQRDEGAPTRRRE